MTDQTPAPTRRDRSAPAISNEAVLAVPPSNSSLIWLWSVAVVLGATAIGIYVFTFSVGTDASAEALLASARTLEIGNVALVGAFVALTGALVVGGLRWRPSR